MSWRTLKYAVKKNVIALVVDGTQQSRTERDKDGAGNSAGRAGFRVLKSSDWQRVFAILTRLTEPSGSIASKREKQRLVCTELVVRDRRRLKETSSYVSESLLRVT